MFAHQGIRSASFLKKFAYELNEWSLFEWSGFFVSLWGLVKLFSALEDKKVLGCDFQCFLRSKRLFTGFVFFFSHYFHFRFSNYMCPDYIYGVPNGPKILSVFAYLAKTNIFQLSDEEFSWFISLQRERVIFCCIALFHHCLQLLEIKSILTKYFWENQQWIWLLFKNCMFFIILYFWSSSWSYSINVHSLYLHGLDAFS